MVDILRGETSVAEASRKHGLTVAESEAWKDHFLAGAETALRSRPLDEDAHKEQKIKRLKQMDILKEAIKATPALRQLLGE